jgi:cytochrome c biogenesis protein
MTPSAAGMRVRHGSRAWRDAVELVSSMRFAISLLTAICIASVVGTVVRQHEPHINYVNQFGPFWADVFGATGLYTVYSAWWFLLILAFLVVSTSLCIVRNTPKVISDLRAFKERVREQALQAFHHKGDALLAESPDAVMARVGTLLGARGWRAKADVRPHGTMIAARKGMANKVGYLAAHSSIVLICIGGLADGDLVVRMQMALGGKSAYGGGGMISAVPPEHRLGASNPTFRGNLLVPEGARAGTAILSMPDGVVLQELPFDIELKKFIVEYYDTGMPRLFASEIVIHDRETGDAKPATVKVNEPAFHRGIAIYQSSFDDGGSTVKLRALPLAAGGQPFEVEGTVGGSTQITNGADKIGVEFTGLRVINVENIGAPEGATDVRKVDLAQSLRDHLGTGARRDPARTLRNVGPSVSYKLVDAAGQRREFQNYMLPVEMDGQRVFLLGMRDDVNEGFRYLRVPADENDAIDSWLRLRHALADAALRERAAARYGRMAAPDDQPQMVQQLEATALRALTLFAGAEPGKAGEAPVAGLQAIARFLESSVPEAERPRISEVLLRILGGSLFELNNLAREHAGLAALAGDERTQAFMTQALVSLSDSHFYPAPVMLQLADFKHVQASVFQVARTPGKKLVYLGSVLLIVGVFAMLYVRERRLWIWLQPGPDGGTHVSTALSTTRRTLDADAEFEQLKTLILRTAP